VPQSPFDNPVNAWKNYTQQKIKDICDGAVATFEEIRDIPQNMLHNSAKDINAKIDKLNSDGDSFTIKGGLKIAVNKGGRGEVEFTVTYKDGGQKGKKDDYYEVKVGGESGMGFLGGAEGLGNGVKVEKWGMGGAKALLRYENRDLVKQAWRNIAKGTVATVGNYASTKAMMPDQILASTVAEDLQGFEVSLSQDTLFKASLGKGFQLSKTKSIKPGNIRFQNNLDGRLKVYLPHTDSNPTENCEATISCESDIFFEGRLGPDLGFNKQGLQKGFWELGRFDLQTKANIEHEFTCSENFIDFNDQYFINDYNPTKTALNLKFNVSDSTNISALKSDGWSIIPIGFDEAGLKIELKGENADLFANIIVELVDNGPFALNRCLSNNKEDIDITGYIKNGSNDFNKGAPGITIGGYGIEASYHYGVQDYNPSYFKTNDPNEFFAKLGSYLP
jgi:hypothetical protein